LGLLSDAKNGLYISGIVEKSPAEKAGLKEGDLLLKANETPLSSTDVLNNLVRDSQGREISLEIMRAGKKSQIKLAAAEQGNNQ
jgi:S1-C subfamily serine protease